MIILWVGIFQVQNEYVTNLLNEWNKRYWQLKMSIDLSDPPRRYNIQFDICLETLLNQNRIKAARTSKSIQCEEWCEIVFKGHRTSLNNNVFTLNSFRFYAFGGSNSFKLQFFFLFPTNFYFDQFLIEVL